MWKRLALMAALVYSMSSSVCFAEANKSLAAAPKNTLIKNVELLETPNGELYNIAIKGRKIVSVSKVVPKDFVADTVLEGKGMLATPGMVNTHGHVPMTLLRGYADDMELFTWLNEHIWPVEAKLDKEDIYWGAMLGIAEMLKSGTTCFADMYFETNEIAAACDRLGIRANVAECVMSVRPKPEEALEHSVEVFKKWHGYDEGRIRVTLAPHAPYTNSDEFLVKVIAAAKENKAELQMHLSETKGEVEDSLKQYGMTPIERMDKMGMFEVGTVAAHAVHLTENDMKIMGQKKVRVAHNPQSNLKLASGIADVNGMLANNITIGVGTDGCSSNNNLDMLEEVRLAAMLHKVKQFNPVAVPAAEAWRMGTENGAKVLGFENVGKLQEGQYADIVLWNMNKSHWYPKTNKMSLLVYAASSSDVDTVFVNGRRVVAKGKLTMFDEKKIYDEVNKRAARLLKK